MHQLIYEVNGWLGYLERAQVVIQLLATLLPVVGARFWLRRFPPRTLARIAIQTATLVFISATMLLLALLGQPYGLSLFLVELYCFWYLLRLLCWLLEGRMDAKELQRLDSTILRPIFCVIAILALIEHVDSLDDLAVIPMGEWFGTTLDVGTVFTSLAALYFVLLGSRPVAIVLAFVIQEAFGLAKDSRRVVQLLVRYLLVSLVVLWICSYVGVNPTAVLAVTGGLSVGLGLGVKEVFSNFVSGVWLLMEGSVRPGDILFIKGDPCEVRSLGLRAALLWRNRDNAEILVPNQIFFSSHTTTYTGTDRTRRSEVAIAAAYRHDPAMVIKILEATAAKIPDVLREPAPKALLLEYGASSINYSLRFFIADPMMNVTIDSAVGSAVWKAFAENGIEIPFPQQVQYNLTGGPAAQPTPSPAPFRGSNSGDD